MEKGDGAKIEEKTRVGNTQLHDYKSVGSGKDCGGRCGG